MVCRTAYLTYTPEITEVTEERVHGYIQPLLIPKYRVKLDYDFGVCCGWDFTDYEFATEEEAQALIDEVLSGKHKWIAYDPELLED